MKDFLINILIVLAGIVSVLAEITYIIILDTWDWIKKHIGGYYEN